MKPPGLQEIFLTALRNEKIPTTFFLVNGFQMKGIVRDFDDYTLLLCCGQDQELVFKHAISTIIPSSCVSLTL